jgi:hypothetical protein
MRERAIDVGPIKAATIGPDRPSQPRGADNRFGTMTRCVRQAPPVIQSVTRGEVVVVVQHPTWRHITAAPVTCFTEAEREQGSNIGHASALQRRAGRCRNAPALLDAKEPT